MSETAAVAPEHREGWRGPARLGVRALAFAAVTFPLLLLHVLTVPLMNFLRLPGGRWSGRLQRVWARGVARILRIRIDVEGRPPDPPFLLVSNHLGYMDVIVLMTQVDAAFVSRADAADWPLLGRLCRAGGAIFLDRERKRDLPQALEEIRATLERGRGVALFPEGTTSDGTGVLPFRSSLLEAAARTAMPVSYATLTYATAPPAPPARLAVCWWGDMTLVPHLTGLAMLPGFRATLRFGGEPVSEIDRKVLAERLERAVRDRFQPVE